MSVVQIWKSIRESRDLTAVSAITNISKLLVTAAAVGGAAIAALALTQTTIALITAGALGATSAFGIGWALVAVNKIRKARRADWNPDLWIQERSSHCVVHDPVRLTYRNRLTAEVLRDQIDHLNWRYCWTGVGTVDVKMVTPGFRCVVEALSDANAHALRILFDRPRRRGDRVEVEFHLEVCGDKHPQRPFTAMAVFESRLPKKAQLGVEFDDEVRVARVTKEVYVSLAALWPADPPEPVELGRDRTIVWPLRVRKQHRYCLRWEYHPEYEELWNKDSVNGQADPASLSIPENMSWASAAIALVTS